MSFVVSDFIDIRGPFSPDDAGPTVKETTGFTYGSICILVFMLQIFGISLQIIRERDKDKETR